MSVLDGLVLLGGVGLTLWLRNAGFPLWWSLAMALGHFFLFCNVFLVWWRLELAWAACFVFSVTIHLAAGHAGWLSPLIMQTPATLFIVWLQMRSPWYHGIFARRLNPRLPEYLDGSL